MLDAILVAHEAIKIQCNVQIELREMCGNKPKREYSHENNDAELKERIAKECYDKAFDVAGKGNPNKKSRSEQFKTIFNDFWATLSDEEKRRQRRNG